MFQKFKAHYFLVGILLLTSAFVAFSVPLKSPKIAQFAFPDSPIDPQFRFVFSEPMNKASVENAFETIPPLEGKFSWFGKTFVFTPDKNLKYDDLVKVKISAGAYSIRGQKLSESFFHELRFPEKSLLFIDEETKGLSLFKVNSKEKKQLTKDLVVRSFDVNQYEKKVVLLASSKEKFLSEEEPVFQVYILDLKTNKIEQLSLREKYNFHYAKWIPFENSLLLSRTKIVNHNGFEFASHNEEDRELALYSLENRQEKSIKKGKTLIYEAYPTPDGLSILFVDDQGFLSLINLESLAEEVLVNDFFSHFGFSEYGAYLVYSVLPGEGIFAFGIDLVMQNQNGEKIYLFKNPDGRIDEPTISPNEDQVAFKFMRESFGAEAVSSKGSSVRGFDLGLKRINQESEYSLFPAGLGKSIEQPKFSHDGNDLVFLKTSIDPQNAFLPRVGYDEYEKKFVFGEVFFMDINTKQTQSTGAIGFSPVWLR
jgi:hypothetical protein